MVPQSQIASPAHGGEGDARLDPLDRLAGLFAAHGRRLEQVAAPLLRGSGSASEDVVGDVILRYAERLSGGAPTPDDEPAYLAQMVRNRCMDLQRSAARWGQPVDTDELGGAVSSAEEIAVGREELAAMVEDLGLLPERQRRAILDVSLGGLSHRDAARRDGVSTQASKSLLARAVRNLRAMQAARQRVGALLGAWAQSIAELLHGPAAAPVAKGLAATVAVVAAVPLATGGDEPSPSRPPIDPVVAVPAAKAADEPARAAVRAPSRPRADARAPKRVKRDATAAVLTRQERTGAWRGLMVDLEQGRTLDARSKDALMRWCRSAGEKGLVGTKSLSGRCPAKLLDTPQRRAKVERVRERRERDAARAKRKNAAAAPMTAPQPEQQPPAAPPPVLVDQPTTDEVAAPPEQIASAGQPTKDAAGPTPLDMHPQTNTEKPPPDPDVGQAGDPGGGVEDPGYIPKDPYVEGEKKPDPPSADDAI